MIEELIEDFNITKVYEKHVVSNGIKYSHLNFFQKIVTHMYLLDKGFDTSIFIDNANLKYNRITEDISMALYSNGRISVREDLPPTDINYSDFLPLIEASTGERYLWDSVNGHISEFHIDTLMGTLDKDSKAQYLELTRTCVFTYRPYEYNRDNYIMGTLGSTPVILINKYVAPDWRLLSVSSKENCPPIIDKLLRHLFCTQKSLDYVLDWLYIMLESRNEVYLVLNGAKGVGKGLFCSFCRVLLGYRNSLEAPLSSLDSNFMAALDENRLVIFDEFKVDKKAHARLKRLINTFQTIEKKGIDADISKETFNSFIISNNDTSDMYLEGDDRRFAVMDINTVMLSKTLSSNELSKLIEACDSEEIAHQLGNWIIRRGKERNINETAFAQYIPQTKQYHLLIYTSLLEWQRFLVDYIVSAENIDEWGIEVSSIKKAFKKQSPESRMPTKFSKFDDFLKNYSHEGKGIIATVDRSSPGLCIQPIKFKKEENDLDIL